MHGTENSITEIQTNCVVVSTRALGDILVGCPPEITKWFIARKRRIPSVIVLPKHFIVDHRLNVEPEFPVYGSFFIEKRKATIVGTTEQLRRIRTVLRESFSGPRGVDGGRREREFLNVRKEGNRGLELEDLVTLVPFSRNRREVDIKGVTIRVARRGSYQFWEKGILLGEVDTGVFTPPVQPPGLFGPDPLEPPRFGVTFLGTGSGFTPHRRTTSFVLWIDGEGIIVDPLADPWAELAKLGIDDGDVSSVFLTHCHADHDAGMISAVLHRRRIRVITSRLVFGSFLRKARAVTGCDMGRYTDFVELDPGGIYRAGHALLVASSALHSIPTVRFEAVFGEGKSKREKRIAYSADTCLDRERIEKMYQMGIIDRKRRRELLHFGFNADLLIHEAGREAIHTSPQALFRLPEGLRRRLIVVHTEDHSGDLEGLRVAREGETVVVVPSHPTFRDRARLMGSNCLLEGFAPEILLRTAERSASVEFTAGEEILGEGEEAGGFYLILRGKAGVMVGGRLEFLLGRGDCFGEASLLEGAPSDVTVRALSNGLALRIDREEFLGLLDDKLSVKRRIRRILSTKPTLSRLAFFQGLSGDQVSRLATAVTRYRGYKGERVLEQGGKGDAFFVLVSGRAAVRVGDTEGRERVVAELDGGDVFGEIALLKSIPRTATVEITSDRAELLRLEERDFQVLTASIPRLGFQLDRICSERLKKLARMGKPISGAGARKGKP
ncbi:MAG: cyclic nucleotide-binding domain-containing protein [Deltaproteobacteria bacterium]|nr:cyclic nucleotide-binding domain-containing protein [Deltaproteobacteria bacterium]